LQQPLADLDCGRLSGTVRAKQAEAFASGDLEIEAIHGDDVAVRLAQVANAEWNW
jgi:hypothetical protein